MAPDITHHTTHTKQRRMQRAGGVEPGRRRHACLRKALRGTPSHQRCQATWISSCRDNVHMHRIMQCPPQPRRTGGDPEIPRGAASPSTSTYVRAAHHLGVERTCTYMHMPMQRPGRQDIKSGTFDVRSFAHTPQRSRRGPPQPPGSLARCQPTNPAAHSTGTAEPPSTPIPKPGNLP